MIETILILIAITPLISLFIPKNQLLKKIVVVISILTGIVISCHFYQYYLWNKAIELIIYYLFFISIIILIIQFANSKLWRLLLTLVTGGFVVINFLFMIWGVSDYLAEPHIFQSQDKQYVLITKDVGNFAHSNIEVELRKSTAIPLFYKSIASDLIRDTYHSEISITENDNFIILTKDRKTFQYHKSP